MTKDMTEGGVFKAIALFAIPMFIGIVFQQIYNFVDTAVVGKCVGDIELGAVGVCAGPFNLILGLLTGLTGGTSVLLAQQFGAKDDAMLRRTFINSCILNISVGVLLTIVGLVVARPLLIILGTRSEQLPAATTYLLIMCGGILANCLYNGMSFVLRAMGDSVTPLVALIVASVLNVVLDLLFVIVFGWQVAGVAVATILSQLISAIMCIVFVFAKMPQLRFGRSDLVIDSKIMKEIIRIGVPAALASTGVSISVMFMQRAINSCGPDVVTGYTVGNKAENIGMGLAYSIGMSVGTFCGQNIGARKFDRVKKGMRVGSLIAVSYALIVLVFMLVFADWFCYCFTDKSEIVKIAVEVIYITMPFAPVLGLIFVFQNFLRSAGDVAPTVWMSITEIVARSVLAFIFVYFWGATGIWWVTPIGWCMALSVGVLRYFSGAWKKRILAQDDSNSQKEKVENV